MSQNHQLLFLKGYFLILDRASHRASLKFSSAVCDGALWKGLGAAFVPPEGKHRTLMPETFVCTYLSPCIAWSSLLSAITPTDIFYITNAFPGHVFNMCCSCWWWDLTDGVMRHGKEWLVQHHQQVQQCWWLSSYFLNPPMGISWMGAGFWSSFCCALFCSVINPPCICAAPGFVSKLCTHLLILRKCSEAMFRNQLRFILLALCRWKHLLVIQHDYVCLFQFGIWPNLYFPSLGRLTWREVHAPLHARNRFGFCMKHWVLWEQTEWPTCYPVWNTVGKSCMLCFATGLHMKGKSWYLQILLGGKCQLFHLCLLAKKELWAVKVQM